MKWGISAMPLKTSLFNKEIILQIGRGSGWLSIIYFIGLLFPLPLRMLMMYSNESGIHYYLAHSLFQYEFQIQLVLLIIVPVLMAVFIFRFLHVKQATDLMHSLPLKRETLFHHYTLTGIIFLLVPVTLIAVIILILRAALDLGSLFTVGEVFYWLGITLLFNFVLYMAGVLLAVLTGISAVQAVLTYVFLLFPAGMTLLLLHNIKFFLYGFPGDYYLNTDLEKMSPITYAAGLDSNGQFQWGFAIFYIMISIILYALSLFLYRKRQLETASEAIAFPKLRLVFKYGVTFIVMLIGGMYFNEISHRGYGWTLFGYGVGAIFGFYLAEMLLKKTWRVFNHIRGLLVYSLTITFLVIIVQVLGIYENHIPDQSKIKSVILTDNPNLYLYHDGMNDEYYVPTSLKDERNIDAVLRLHSQLLSDKEEIKGEEYESNANLFFVYELDNGRKVVREYRVNMELYKDLYKPIYESEEYKMASRELFKIDETKVEFIQIRAYGPVSKGVFISESQDVKNVINLLREDVLAESYEDSLYFRSRGYAIDLNLGSHKNVVLEYKPSYQRFTSWLEERNLLEQAKVTASDFSHVLVGKIDLSESDLDPDNVKSMLEQSPNILKLIEKNQINIALNQAGIDHRLEYAAIYYYNNGVDYEIMYFDEKHAPKFVKDHFQ
jgi:ABC-2 type transport system permease protein